MEASVRVTPGSAVGEVHHTSPLYIMFVMIPNMFPTNIKVNNEIAKGKNVFPVFQCIESLIIPFTKSKIHSIPFWAPVGFICNFLAPRTERTKTMIEVTIIINTFDKFTDNQGIPKMFSIIGDPCSIVSPPYSNVHFLLNHKKSIIMTG